MTMTWIVLGSMLAGALISELYHARMWTRYQQGKTEGRKVRDTINNSRSITIQR